MIDGAYLKKAAALNGIDIEKSSDDELRIFLQRLNVAGEDIDEAIAVVRGKAVQKVKSSIRTIFSGTPPGGGRPVPSFLAQSAVAAASEPSRSVLRIKKLMIMLPVALGVAALAVIALLEYRSDPEGWRAKAAQFQKELPQRFHAWFQKLTQ